MATETTETCGLCNNPFELKNKGYRRINTEKLSENRDFLIKQGLEIGSGFLCYECATPIKRLIKADGELKSYQTLLSNRVTKRRLSPPSTLPQRKIPKLKSPKLVKVTVLNWEYWGEGGTVKMHISFNIFLFS